MISSKEEHWHLTIKIPLGSRFKTLKKSYEKLYEEVEKIRFKTEEEALIYQRENQGKIEDIEEMETWRFTPTYNSDYPYNLDESKTCDICHPKNLSLQRKKG